MPGLLDIAQAAQQREVEVLGTKVTVKGLTGNQISELLIRFPQVVELMGGQGMKLITAGKVAPQALAAIIAMGCQQKEDLRDLEDKAASLPLEIQIDLVFEVGRLTFPSGYGPFVEKLKGMAEAVAGKAGKDQATSSATPSPPLSPRASRLGSSGTSPQNKSPPTGSTSHATAPSDSTSKPT